MYFLKIMDNPNLKKKLNVGRWLPVTAAITSGFAQP